MRTSIRRKRIVRVFLAAGLVLSASLLTTGCYLGHLAAGQVRLLLAREPLDVVRARPETPADVRERLDLVPAVRAFAESLGLEVGAQYTTYAPWPGDRIVTAVIATEPGHVEPAGFWFPIVGEVPYKGFFSVDRAEREAETLRGDGYDVCLAAVPAYSTLGWMDDPVTGPMVRGRLGWFVETLIHELVHRTAFAKDAADFNEGLATYVGQEASILFFSARDGPESEAARAQRALVQDERTVSARLVRLRADVAALYASMPPGDERNARRDALAEAARDELSALPLGSRDPRAWARSARLNDACLALEGTYTADLARYAAREKELGGLGPLLLAARAAVETPDPRVALLGAGP